MTRLLDSAHIARTRPKRTQDEGGFTLVELLVTIVIMGIAFAAVLDSMLTSTQSSATLKSQATAETTLRSFAEAVKNAPFVGTGITEASNTSPIKITATSHGLANGDAVWIDGVEGNTAANGVWVVDGMNVNTFDLKRRRTDPGNPTQDLLVNSTGNGTSTIGTGRATKLTGFAVPADLIARVLAVACWDPPPANDYGACGTENQNLKRLTLQVRSPFASNEDCTPTLARSAGLRCPRVDVVKRAPAP